MESGNRNKVAENKEAELKENSGTKGGAEEEEGERGEGENNCFCTLQTTKTVSAESNPPKQGFLKPLNLPATVFEASKPPSNGF